MEKRIIRLLRGAGRGLTFREIFTGLGLPVKEKRALQKSLRELAAAGAVRRVRNRFSSAPQDTVFEGRFSQAQGGFGFVASQGRDARDIFVPARSTGGAMQGDIVRVTVKEHGREGKPEGRVTRIVRRGQERILGIYALRNGQPLLLPFEAAGGEGVPLKTSPGEAPQPGMVVTAGRDSLQVEEVLGFPDDPGVDTETVVRRFNLARVFAPEALAEADAFPEGISAEELAGRADFRSWTTVTIDGETAQDFDDAVGVRPLGSGRTLLAVHIADVSSFVRPGSALDREAFARATSVYLPDLTLPMLPERLSNNLCSLRPREDRKTFSVLMEVDGGGRVVSAEFRPSVIRTIERLTYTSVFKVFNEDSGESLRYREILPDLLAMRALARVMRTRRMEEGSLDFDLPEPELVYEQGRLSRVDAGRQNEAQKVIEDFMIAANEAVAAFLEGRAVRSLHRIHPPPEQADLEKLREVLLGLGFALPHARKVTSRDLQRVLDEAEGRPEEKLVNREVLRALRLAVYADESRGHYGLARKAYTHFTSPIRRYPDLVVHRILKDVLDGKKPEERDLAAAALHSSLQERNADAAEKDLVEWRIFRMMKSMLGETLTATVVEINKAGLVLAPDDAFVEGLLAFSDLAGDYYRLKSPGTLVGRRTGRVYRLGDRLEVVLAGVDPLLRRMSFVPADAGRMRRR
ncbi:MAG: ribonuclease R [Candidatus Aminicenantes bacterium RBG_13_62_12]|nr:MAG: ribonuclease R [Candidatus Aminicenantes bacterium RBG_13_62_12]